MPELQLGPALGPFLTAVKGRLRQSNQGWGGAYIGMCLRRVKGDGGTMSYEGLRLRRRHSPTGEHHTDAHSIAHSGST